jgi:hypothetical protein
MRRLAKWHPLLVWFLLAVGVVALSPRFGLQYDEGPLGLLWVLFAFVVTTPFLVVGSVVRLFTGASSALEYLVPIVTGLLMIAADVKLWQWSRRGDEGHAEA